MPEAVHRIYWDSCVFLSYLNGDSERLPNIDGVLQEVEHSSGKKKIVTSTISRVEVSFAVTEREQHSPDPAVESAIDQMWSDVSVIECIELHDEIALLARDLIRASLTSQKTLKPLDAIHLASARWIGANALHTYDRYLQSFETFLSASIGPPTPNQLLLSFS
jgi:predicted nucleic acid-binding protein